MIIQEKISQAKKLLQEFNIDCWITFTREKRKGDRRVHEAGGAGKETRTGLGRRFRPGRGVATIEEMVVVTSEGAHWLSSPKKKLILIGSKD